MKEYMFLIRNEIDHQSSWNPEQHQRFLSDCQEYIGSLMKGGKLKSAQPLEREGLMVSRVKDTWKTAPFSESREVIIGYYHILANSMDEAITIAQGNPEFKYGKTARIEVRPIKGEEGTTGFRYPDRH